MSLAAGTRLASYEIVGLLGAGGMGEVYRARDVRLNRHVALKVIIASGEDEGRRRLLAEARAAAAVNHPNICQIASFVFDERLQPIERDVPLVRNAIQTASRHFEPPGFELPDLFASAFDVSGQAGR
jgi:serine/threonine protein kinase